MFSSAFSSSIQAMKAYSQSFAAISDNVANISTSGYKDVQIQFKDLVANSVRGSIFDSLGGSRPVVRNYTQHAGAITPSARALDAALNGKGYFLSNTKIDGSGDYLMTAAGHFDLHIPSDAAADETYVVDQGGNYLLGWPYNSTTDTFNTGTNLSSLSPIRVDSASSAYGAIATSLGSMKANLKSDAAIGDSQTFSISILDGTGTGDGASDKQQVNFTWTKTGSDTWSMTVTADNGTVTSPATPSIFTFDANGQSVAINGAGDDLTVAVNWASSGASSNVTFDFSELSQYAGTFSLEDYATNGIEEGVIQSVFFGENGIVMAAFTNGQSRPIAKIPAADVMSPENLERVGETHFRVTDKSGDIELYEINATDRVQFIAQAFEESSVDLGEEMTNMIITQRAYSTAATTLKTIDEMFKTATDLK